MDQLAKNQHEVGETIQRIISNYKKDPAERKNIQYCEERLQRLNEQWKLFVTRNNLIKELPDPPKDHEYFTRNYFHSVWEIYEKLRIELEEKINPEKKTASDDTQEKNETDATSNVGLHTSNKESTSSSMPNTTLDVTRISRRQSAIIDSLNRLLRTINFTDPQPQVYYQLKIKNINYYWNKIEDLNHTIWEISEDPSTIGYDVDGYLQLEEQTQNLLIELSSKLKDYKETKIGSPMIQLPTIVIPKFDGDYLKWKQFHDLFTEMVHNQQMPNCQKLWYLKTNLIGEAERLLRHFSLSEENYTTAWRTLQDRYNNQRLLVSSLINKLLSQPSHASENTSAAAIKCLHDTTQECLLGLQNLGVPTDNWDPLLLHILLKKLDRTSHTLYEQSLRQPRELQHISNFLSFLETRFQSLEVLNNKARVPAEQKGYGIQKSMMTLASTSRRCVSCKGNHPLYACKKFMQLSPANRLKLVQRYKLCVNCLKDGHNSSNCTLRGCTKCSKRHNSLLHLNIDQPRSSNINPSSDQNHKNIEHTLSMTASKQMPPRGYVLLSTAKVKLALDNGQEIECRAILDSGSQVNIITEHLVKKFGLHPSTKYSMIQGIGSNKQGAKGRVNLLLKSRLNTFTTRMEACVLPHIVSMQPSQPLDVSAWNIPHNINLADPNFCTTGKIDLLIGAEFYHQLLSVGQIKLSSSLPTLQNTVFGWILSGKIAGVPQTSAVCNINVEENLDKTIKKFWEMEEAEVPKTKLTTSEKKCELHYDHTVQLEEDGHFKVRLPFSDEPTMLGESKDIALRRFYALEKRLTRNIELQQHYSEFMNEYIRLGHMEEVDSRKIQIPNYYIPHHCVLKPSSSTTKLRVVFDASSKTSTNLSFNDILLTGPTIQDDLFSILLRFRMPRFVFTADIEKMFRQIHLHKEDQNYHLIFWRNSPNEPLRTYRLCTVTYGTTSAPYLAIKCLQRLAEKGLKKYPLGAGALSKDFYVDDCMSGSDNIRIAKYCQEQLISLLKLGGFKLRKWCANHPQLLQDISPADQEIQLDFSKGDEDQIKTLGLIWLPKSDQFRVKVIKLEESRVTKRVVASDIARLFDPLGFVAPVIITAKIFLQELWQLNLHWDAALPAEMHTRWCKFRENLYSLNELQIPRHMHAHEIHNSVQLHGFADASEKAFGAAVYVRSTTKNGKVIVRLLCAKSRVAPLKKLTIPRLELCAAKLAAELTNRVKTTLKLENATTLLWSDSEIVLNWINSPSSKFQTFVANRIASIQEITIAQQWRHVCSKQNPVDVLSRGVSPDKLASCLTWFYGPQFLHGNESIWPPAFKQTTPCDLERRKITLLTQDKGTEASIFEKINHRNSFRKLQRIIAYMLRFVESAKGKVRPDSFIITPIEQDNSLQIIIKYMQSKEFIKEIQQLKTHGRLKKNSHLLGLTPFIDNNGIIRVGGRLDASNLSYDAKHQMLLPYSHELTKLLMTDLHQENKHVDVQGLISATRQRFWPIKVKTIANSVVHHCIRCKKAKPKMFSQLMGNLPAHRIQPARPFVNSGVDFCGPIKIHLRGRGNHPQKGYLAVFCCFSTKAVHLEVVSDLTTDAFIGALRRFTGRRGHCSHLYCDNATNFVGARNRLEELYGSIYSDNAKEKIQSACIKKSIEFHFIPPRTPHFGGLWEAAVKSAKHFLKRNLESAALTYEELETLIIEIEAILNSRPLTAMSNNPNDLTALTPGHFLIGEPMTATVDPNAEPIKGNLNSKWNIVSRIKSEFWRRWSLEYLHELQYRSKWKNSCENVVPDTIVIIRDDNLPIMKWPLGRIVKVYKGEDGYVRVADVRTSSGTIRRPITRLSPLLGHANNLINNSTDPAVEEGNDQRSKRPREENQLVIKKGSTNKEKIENTNNPKASDKKRRKNSYLSSILTTLLVCMVMPLSKGNPVNISKFNSQPGIHFDNLGNSRIISNEWNLVVYYDLQPYWNEFEGLYNGTLILEQLCSRIKLKDSCQPLLEQLNDSILQLNQENKLLTPNPISSRFKRGAFNFVGNIANSLFGVLDSQYAEEISKTIFKIHTNEDYVMKLLKNQTSIIDSTINIIKRDQGLVKRKFDELDKQLTEIRIQNSNMSMFLYQHKIQHLFSSWSARLTLTIIMLQRTQASIIDVITDSHNGKINHLLLSPQQLIDELQKIKLYLPPSSRLPADDLMHIYKIMRTEGRIVNSHVIFKLKLPLVYEDKFELFRLFPIPATLNNTPVIMETSTKLLAINLRRDKYFPMTENEFSSCNLIENIMFLCKQYHPIFSTRTKINACEFNLFNDILNNEECKLKNSEHDNTWIKLSQANQWMYALTEKSILNTVCNDTAIPITLEGSGIITIQAGCTITHELLTIHGHQVYQSQLRTSYTKQKDLKLLTVPDYLAHISKDALKYKDQHVKINELLKRVSSQNLEFPKLSDSQYLHHNIVSYTGLILGCVLVIILGWVIKTLQKHRRTDKKPIHLPGPVLDFTVNLDES